jgi:hypothetical protein
MKAKSYRLDHETGKYVYFGIKRIASKIEHVRENKPLAGVCDPYNTLNGPRKQRSGVNVDAIKNFLARDEANDIQG